MPIKEILLYLDATINDEECSGEIIGPSVVHTPKGSIVKVQCPKSVARRLLRRCPAFLKFDADPYCQVSPQ